MLNFNDTQKAFAYKSDEELKKARFLFGLMQYNALVKLGTLLTPLALKIKFPIKGIIRKTLFQQFVGGASLEESSPVISNLEKEKVSVILDYGVEGGEYNDEKYDHSLNEFIKVIRFASTKKNAPFISVKITGLSSTNLLEKLNLNAYEHVEFVSDQKMNEKINALDSSEKDAWNKLLKRTDIICDTACQCGVGIMIDAEETWIQDPIDYITILMSRKYNKSNAVVYNTIQFYRHDRISFMHASHQDSVQHGYQFAVKIVRGAYMEKERARAQKLNYSSPIHSDKKNVDHDYDQAIEFLTQHESAPSLIVASHNEKSTQLAVTLSQKKETADKQLKLHFSQLYGMSDHLTFNLASEGYDVSKYLPFGPIEEVIPYLMRRAQENSSVAGQTNRELTLIKEECKRRGI
ncbi:MAG: hypothetical protein RI965_494 [Bacteroidota bacterium]